ncbi:MAG: hypothetical protein ACJAT1_002120 [Marivirga sp.]|jgi:hypothetical protein
MLLTIAAVLACCTLQASEITVGNETSTQEERIIVQQDLRITKFHIPRNSQNQRIQQKLEPLMQRLQRLDIADSKKLYLFHCELTFYE